MSSSIRFSLGGDSSLEVLWEDGERVFCRGRCDGADGDRRSVLVVLPAVEHPSALSLDRLAHEFSLRDEMEGAWAVRPLELVRENNRSILVLDDPGGEPLHRLLGKPMQLERFLPLAIGISAALGRVHQRGLVHKDVKPTNILVNAAGSAVWLTGFGMASRLPRERQSPEPPELIAGTLAYMAPEQTGRMNRSVDWRSDLYALGVTLYELLTGNLPFTASDPMELVHCHIARRPLPPCERLADIPGPVSAVVMKLLAKTAEDRYQTALGLERDLRRCLVDWGTRRCIEGFPLGEHDTPDRLLIPEKLYGRAPETEALLASFDRVVKSGTPELVLISGYSGVGKSSVVNELHKVLVPPRGLFASGKFDQYKRDIPYSTLAEAFQRLVRPLLGKSEIELGCWRDALREALGPNGRLVADLVPQLTVIVGEQPPVSDLPPQDAQRRFQLVFRRFIGVFARPEHPLALFLDDLQWLDAATLDLIEDLLTRPDVRHLMLIGAYRDNEVAPTHPLMTKLEAIRRTGATVQQIFLAPLSGDDLERLLVDCLQCQQERVTPLAHLIHEKTAGNPFFAIQFISALAEEQLLVFDHDGARWSWDLNQIYAKGYTDNVADLMVGKLNRLPVKSQQALQEFSCLGNTADVKMLTIIHGTSEENLHKDLWEAASLEFITLSARRYRFVHDRLQEAAYSLVPQQSRAEAHLRIGRLLAAHTPTNQLQEAIFDIVHQFNRGAALTTSQAERGQIAGLNLIAAKRAKASAAYSSALRYLTAGRALLTEAAWERQYRLTFDLELNQAECEILTGAPATAEERLAELSRRSKSLPDSAAIACMRVDLYTNLDQAERAIQIGFECLRLVGIIWSLHPTDDEVNEEYARIWQRLGTRTVEDLLELPSMTDTNSCAAVDVLTSLQAPAHFVDRNLVSLIIGRMATLSLTHGNTDGSCFAYVYLGMILQERFGDYRRGLQFGELGINLVEKNGLDRFRARVYNNFGMAISPWTSHVRTSIDLLRLANHTALEVGDQTFMGYSHTNLISALLISGDPLSDVQREAETALTSLQRARFGTAIDMVLGQLGLVRALRGLTANISTFSHAEFDESRFARHLELDPGLAMPAGWYWIRKMQACYLAGAYEPAVAAATSAEAFSWTSPGFIVMADYHFYAALARLARYGEASADERDGIAKMIETHRRTLAVWAESCPETFANRAALIAAESARIEGRILDAMHLYEEAVRSAKAGGFVNNEALANELAARFYAARGFDRISHTYLRDARHCYLRWGADAKVRQLEALHPHLRETESIDRPAFTIATPIEQLDFATVVKVSQAVSREMVPERLIDALMRMAIEHAGAERGLLLLLRENELRQEAEATTDAVTLLVKPRNGKVIAGDLPELIVHYVARAREIVILDDALAHPQFSADPYVRQRNARSILCLPLMNQSRLTGILYLENNLTPHVFTPSRIAVLKLLASQAAISLENTRLYADLEEREGKIRRLVEANIVGIFIWNVEGEIIEANEAFLQMLHYRHADLRSGCVRWMDLTPLEWRHRTEQALEELKATGTAKTYEKEYFRKDGSRVPVLVGSAAFGGRGDEGVAFVVDLTERKRAEAEAVENVRRHGEMQMELEHANRVATMGHLSASIAHEVNQPIAATLINAQTALRWLTRQPPDLERATQAIDRVVHDGKLAADIVSRTRELFKKVPPRKDNLQLNGAILEVIALTRGEMSKNCVLLQTQLTEGLPLVQCDRVQLQQVMLNLIINAVEAMSQMSGGHRELLISTRKEQDRVLVEIRDSGPGLSEVALEQVFEAFHTTKSSGLGMGLSICRSIVEAHGGRLWATANAPQGAIFQFTVPTHSEANIANGATTRE